MYRVGREEADAIAHVLMSGRLFRYGRQSQCERFERRYAKYLGVKHALMTSSGTTAITAALAGLEIGPGCEVIVPACTYMATAVSVLAVGAIPVIVDIDDSITISPAALEDAIGPRTKAVIPVHMWGLPCDMNAVMRIARKRRLVVVEDACQAVGGGYEGRKLGAIGHAGAFSFNYYKNMTCGEGGAIVTSSTSAMQRATCTVDCCNFYWKGRRNDVVPFTFNGARASEIEGAMLNAQLNRIDAMTAVMRRQKKGILAATADTGLVPARANSLDHECGAYVAYTLADEERAGRFAVLTRGTVAGKTGRHVYTEWDPVLQHHGAHHPALDPFNLPENRRCRKAYSLDMCRRSLDILNRTVLIGNHPDRKAAEVKVLVRKIRTAAAEVL